MLAEEIVGAILAILTSWQQAKDARSKYEEAKASGIDAAKVKQLQDETDAHEIRVRDMLKKLKPSP